MKGTSSIRFKSLRSFASVAAASIALFAANAARAVETGLNETAKGAGISTKNSDITTTVGALIKALLGFVGVLFLVLTIYAGFLWMTSQGNEEQVTKAKKILTGAVIGMIIVLASYSITTFVVTTTLKTSGN